MADVLRHIDTLTTKSQNPNNVPGDFFLNWLDCVRSLKKLNSEFWKKMLDCMNNRSGFLNNKFLLTACFLDPRVKNLLSEEQTKIAIKHVNEYLSE